ncbi:hypothetical protein JL100_020835 [Skermanella mucosa]|uniref:hypothetical protein n=1 Tax=Skermanella mucosa TaxID=1789672 RepID=UPI00192B304E|nr:hypothetical protein [Skermanella mucosa]UEM19519.1 hypothetical protein JL100_020835 [Skermanella mucosa]
MISSPAPSLSVPPAVLVHGIDGLRAALAAAASLGRPLTVVSLPGAAGSAGASWFHALVQAGSAEHPDVPLTAVLDCGDQPGHALAALRVGVRHLLLADSVPAWPRVRAIAEAAGATLYGLAGPVFDPRFFRDPVRGCREWLAVNP